MGKPAACVGDQTTHQGSILPPGCLNVLIGGSPAARVGDFQICFLFNGPQAHVGGMIRTGSQTVWIGGLPAARVGDNCDCPGPPNNNFILGPGCPTVLIGD